MRIAREADCKSEILRKKHETNSKYEFSNVQNRRISGSIMVLVIRILRI